jgi:hypothetical protein|nr:MAG TPA: hypothetical protein [Caudoviricetes sp.]
MATVTIPWEQGSGDIMVALTGTGDGVATLSTGTVNEGVDRSRTVTFRTVRGGNVEVMRTVRQEGRREYLRDASGDLLRDSNDVELKALK